MKLKYDRMRLLLVSALLALAVYATYLPVLQNDFLNYDDPDYVTANEAVKEGFGWPGVEWAFTTGHASNWHPLTWLSHMLDVSLFGMNPHGHHLTNLLLHCATTTLLLLFLRQMTGALWRSAMVAALFALHPLHVESVAWVAERKDVLSAFFGLLSLMAYARYAQKGSGIEDRGPRTRVGDLPPHPRRSTLDYWLALTFFALGLMSKPMLVTWPFVMLLLDFWPLNRIRFKPQSLMPAMGGQIRKLILEKIPFFLLSVISSVVTFLVQRDALAKSEIVPIGARFSNAIISCISYLQQTVYPAKLAVFYPFPADIQPMTLLVGAVVLIAISVFSIRRARTHPFLMVGWLWFLGTLVPVIGLVQVGAQARADRYTYLPLIGIFLALSWGLAWLAMNRLWLQRLVPVATVTVLIALGLTSRHQLQYWHDDRALCAHAAEVTTENYLAWGGLGIVDAKAGDWPGAMTNLTRAYEYAQAHHTERSISYYIGVALQMQGKPKEALPYLQDCTVSTAMQPELNHRLGLSLMDAGRLAEAETCIKMALEAKPRNLEYNLGMAALLMAKGDATHAEPIYADATAKHPNEPVALKSYGDFLALVNRPVEAEPRYAAAVRLKPANPAYRKSYAGALQRNGKTSLAAEQLEEAFKLAKPSSRELLDLAELYAQQNQAGRVLDCYNRALAAEPDSVPALNNCAWLLATSPEDGIRDGHRAVVLAEKACTINEWQAAVLMGTLAAADAEAGRFSDAIAMAEKAIAKARADNQEDTAKRNAELLELYRAGKPYRDK